MVVWRRKMILQLLMVLVATSHANPASNSSVHRVRSMVMCRPDEHDALLSFKMGFATLVYGYAKTGLWEKNGSCCGWDGVTCDSLTGHVVKLDLGFSLPGGSFLSNTTRFLINLPRLRHLSLAGNSLSGQVPPELGWLSQLTTLDLSYNMQLQMPNFQTIIANMTHLRKLDLTFVSIASNLPPIIFNFSKLASLGMSGVAWEASSRLRR
ncbi:hypothetical protein V2J09_017501 [Rumex salicifolius]